MLLELALTVALAHGGARCEPIREPYAGTLCAPNAGARHPAMIVLGGSEGGDSMRGIARRFAERGYVATTVSYFGQRGLPNTLQQIPVENVGRALDALLHRKDVDGARVGILGVSKGGELALLAASTYSQIHAVVADVPSPFAWSGIAGATPDPGSSWTVSGKPVPYVLIDASVGMEFMAAMQAHRPVSLRPAYDASMQNREAVDKAMFHLERINGPVLFLAGDDDKLWDSPAQSKLGMEYLRAHHHPFADLYRHYPQAGHLFIAALDPHVNAEQADVGNGLSFAFGGTPQGNRSAGRQAWAAIDTFVKERLRP
ncbi:MAG: acetylxylan esterase [Candidatus Eremiobacteraeota bacterium]|nr:acetylxylan esterase [Candidatus Eremiobacteraeota bacterium]